VQLALEFGAEMVILGFPKSKPFQTRGLLTRTEHPVKTADYSDQQGPLLQVSLLLFILNSGSM
jgi:hypothetical protein